MVCVGWGLFLDLVESGVGEMCLGVARGDGEFYGSASEAEEEEAAWYAVDDDVEGVVGGELELDALLEGGCRW